MQNRGTVSLVNTLVEITTPFGSRQFNATTLAPGGIQTFSMPVRLSGLPKGEPIEVNSSLTLGTTGQDITPRTITGATRSTGAEGLIDPRFPAVLSDF